MSWFKNWFRNETLDDILDLFIRLYDRLEGHVVAKGQEVDRLAEAYTVAKGEHARAIDVMKNVKTLLAR